MILLSCTRRREVRNSDGAKRIGETAAESSSEPVECAATKVSIGEHYCLRDERCVGIRLRSRPEWTAGGADDIRDDSPQTHVGYTNGKLRDLFLVNAHCALEGFAARQGQGLEHALIAKHGLLVTFLRDRSLLLGSLPPAGLINHTSSRLALDQFCSIFVNIIGQS
jgi:hypothetical protein